MTAFRVSVMRGLREHGPWAAGAVAALSVMWCLSVHAGWSWPDWAAEGRPAAGALLAGHALRFLQLAPAEGSFVLRAPFMMLTELWHGGNLSIYWASSVPCLAAPVALGVWIVARMRRQGASAPARAIALCLCVVNPLTFEALRYGHPEEPFGAALCIAAVVCALRDRPGWAGVLLGLAIGNKAWAVLAIGPVLIALPRARVQTLLLGGAVAAVVLGPIVLVPGSVAAAQSHTFALTPGVFQPWQLWWFFGAHPHAAVTGLHIGYRTPPGWLGGLSHPLIAAVTVPLSLLYVWVGRRRAGQRRAGDVFLLLALLFLLRCALDPWDISYYSVPFLLTLLSWEAVSGRRVPVVALASTLAASLAFNVTGTPELGLSPDAQALAFALVSLTAIAVLAAALYLPARGRRAPDGRPAPAPATA